MSQTTARANAPFVAYHDPGCAWVHGLADCDCPSGITADTPGAVPVTVLEP